MEPKGSYTAGEHRISFDPVEDVETTVQILVFAEVEVNGVEDEADGNVPMERRYEEPGTQVVAGDEARDALPDFRGCSLRCGLVDEMNLGDQRAVSMRSLSTMTW